MVFQLGEGLEADLSGAMASDRFTYQHTWALCHLLELHISGQDYVVIFDHHEDVRINI